MAFCGWVAMPVRAGTGLLAFFSLSLILFPESMLRATIDDFRKISQYTLWFRREERNGSRLKITVFLCECLCLAQRSDDMVNF